MRGHENSLGESDEVFMIGVDVGKLDFYWKENLLEDNIVYENYVRVHGERFCMHFTSHLVFGSTLLLPNVSGHDSLRLFL